MAFPLIPVIVAVVGLLAAAGAAAALWPDAKGKRLLVTGATAVGKTTLAEFLASGVIPLQYVKTRNTRTRIPNGDIELKDLSLKIDKIWDAAGDRESWQAWLDTAKKADAILYLVDYSRRDSKSYCQMVRRDSGQIALWRRQGDLQNDAQVVLVVTHCDAAANAGHEAAHAQARASAPVQTAIAQLGASVPLVAGSLKGGDNAAALAYDVMETLGWGQP